MKQSITIFLLAVACSIILSGCKDSTNSSAQILPIGCCIDLQLLSDNNSVSIKRDIAGINSVFALEDLSDFVNKRIEQEAKKNCSIQWTLYTPGYIEINSAISLIQPFAYKDVNFLTIFPEDFVREADPNKIIDYGLCNYNVVFSVNLPQGCPDSVSQYLLEYNPQLHSNRYWFRAKIYELRDVLLNVLNSASHITIETSQSVNANHFAVMLDALKYAEVSYVNFMAIITH